MKHKLRQLTLLKKQQYYDLVNYYIRGTLLALSTVS
jgi:hypothetical protein